MSTKKAAQGAQLSYMEIRKQSDVEIAEQQLQYDCKDNLNSLSDSIEKTQRALDSATRSRTEMLNRTKVDWAQLAQKDQEIEGYQAGLKALKNFRNIYFPTWKEMVVID